MAVFGLASGVWAAELTVAADGSADYDTIGAALLDAQPEDHILIADGIYAPSTNGEVFPLEIGGGLTLTGESRAGTVIDGEFSEGLLRISWTEEGGPVLLSKLTLTGGEAPQDGEADVLYMWQAQAQLEQVDVVGNGDPDEPDSPWNQDSWVDVRTSELSFQGARFAGNRASHTGILCSDGTVDLSGVQFENNYAYYGVLDLQAEACQGDGEWLVLQGNEGTNCSGAYLDLGTGSATTVLASGNDVGPCRLIRAGDLIHATVVGNDASGAMPLVEVDRLGHSIVAFNSSGVRLAADGYAAHNCVYGNASQDWDGDDPTGNDGNLSFDPQLAGFPVDEGLPDLHLADDSPLLDAGGSELTATWDMEGNERPIDSDMDGVALPEPGAFEHPPVQPADDDDDSAAADDDDGCACAQGQPGPGADDLPVLLALTALFLWIRKRGQIVC